ncbi:hypothetical protein PUNSTDRAFT_64949 [Punctularia strigosozonata HHB-11173 SS5]|uniref:uncharacterized protein n=1 Tax=Punctularia strigosozonata (strain HHB-11173) TaxID=741275 RepID=UPI0004417B92|nr:uncharacterized protein PUNSTDRAFT_64949 [Punctularia strigosozonata HHB-11173 SS5]EIN10992.1 hypothetical protein PUNSTDRAFT_64949 [Punctularia strigosozonata HHB-11173 SS5]
MIKRRNRPHQPVRAIAPRDGENEAAEVQDEAGDEELGISDLIELRKLRRAREGIDATKLTVGDAKKRRKKKQGEDESTVDSGGLKAGAALDKDHDDEDEEDDKEAKARRAVRTSNFTQQTNTLDVDRHMMAYIEENMAKLRGAKREEKSDDPADPYAELNRLADRYKFSKKNEKEEEGNVTNSLAMLTAIPEVDLGMDARLKNIEETERAKRIVAEERKDNRRKREDEEQIPGSRFYRPNHNAKTDAEILRNAKLEAMGLPPQEENRRPHNERTQMATDEMVMERFKKRMKR